MWRDVAVLGCVWLVTCIVIGSVLGMYLRWVGKDYPPADAEPEWDDEMEDCLDGSDDGSGLDPHRR